VSASAEAYAAPRDRLDRPVRVLFPLWVVGSTLIVLAPIYVLFMVSVAPGAAIFGELPALIVTEPTLRFWGRVIERGDLWMPLLKSLSVASLTTLGAILVASPGAYVIARLPARLRYPLVIGLLVTRMFPEFAIGVSVATRFARLGLVDNYLGLILAHLIGSLPFIAWILVGTFEDILGSGGGGRHRRLSRLGTLLRVIFPAATPGIAVAALFVWLYSWNEFLYARLLTTSQNTLPLQVFQAIDRGSKQQMAAVGSVLVLPILCVVYFLQRYLRPGALAGAVKG
jgi:trehalose transport system permease protein